MLDKTKLIPASLELPACASMGRCSRLNSCKKANRSARHTLINHAALHHKDDSPHSGDVLQRIAIKRNDVCLQTDRDRADLIGQTYRLRAERIRGNHSRHWIYAAVPDAIDELFGIASVRARDCVGAKNDFQASDLRSAAHQFVV